MNMSIPILNRGLADSKPATSTSNSEVDKNSIQDEIFAEDEDLDDAGGLFGSDEEEEESQYKATLSTALGLLVTPLVGCRSLNPGSATLIRRN